jgi:hypothetical protein
MVGSTTSKPEPFLHKPQKKFGTPRVSAVQTFTAVPRGRVGHPPYCHSHMSGSVQVDCELASAYNEEYSCDFSRQASLN